MKTGIKNISILILLVLTASSFFYQAVSKTRVLVPKNARSAIEINISGKKLKYYPLSTDEATIISVRGPGTLKIITRGQITDENKKSLDYFIYYRINGGKKIKADFNSVRADNKASFYNSDLLGFTSIGENIIVELSRGENTIEIWNGSSNTKIYTRSLFTEKKEKKLDWIKISPIYPNDPVSLVTNEEVLSYFRYSSSKSLKIKITGPTVLRILNRVEFDYKMKGKINYRIEVKYDKKSINTYMLCSDRSEITRYKNDGKKTPGKANEIVINVPSGTHIYELIPLDNYTVLGRILFPKKDIKLEEK
jgi:hypothetical protein